MKVLTITEYDDEKDIHEILYQEIIKKGNEKEITKLKTLEDIEWEQYVNESQTDTLCHTDILRQLAIKRVKFNTLNSKAAFKKEDYTAAMYFQGKRDETMEFSNLTEEDLK